MWESSKDEDELPAFGYMRL